MLPRRFAPVEDGEWVQPRMRNYYAQCCDCGLVHRVNFRIVRGKRRGKLVTRIQFQAFRVTAEKGRRKR